MGNCGVFLNNYFFWRVCSILEWCPVRAPKREKKSRSENSGTRIWIKSEDTPGCHEFLFTSDKSVLLVIIGTEEGWSRWKDKS
jgi:hypothetical protein